MPMTKPLRSSFGDRKIKSPGPHHLPLQHISGTKKLAEAPPSLVLNRRIKALSKSPEHHRKATSKCQSSTPSRWLLDAVDIAVRWRSMETTNIAVGVRSRTVYKPTSPITSDRLNFNTLPKTAIHLDHLFDLPNLTFDTPFDLVRLARQSHYSR